MTSVVGSSLPSFLKHDTLASAPLADMTLVTPVKALILSTSSYVQQSPLATTGTRPWVSSSTFSTTSRNRCRSAGSLDRMVWVRQCTVRQEMPVATIWLTSERVSSCEGRSRILQEMSIDGRLSTRCRKICGSCSLAGSRSCASGKMDGPRKASPGGPAAPRPFHHW